MLPMQSFYHHHTFTISQTCNMYIGRTRPPLWPYPAASRRRRCKQDSTALRREGCGRHLRILPGQCVLQTTGAGSDKDIMGNLKLPMPPKKTSLPKPRLILTLHASGDDALTRSPIIALGFKGGLVSKAPSSSSRKHGRHGSRSGGRGRQTKRVQEGGSTTKASAAQLLSHAIMQPSVLHTHNSTK